MTPDVDAKRRALELLASQVGGAPVASLQPADMAPLALPPDQDTEARLRSEADATTRFADLGAVGSRFIEGTTGARGADIWTPMRERAQEPLKAFLAMEQRKASLRPAAAGKAPKPPPDPNSPDSKRLQAFARARWPQEADDVIAAIVPETFESIRKTLDAKYGMQSREVVAGRTAEQRAQEHKDKIRIAAQRVDIDERKLEQAMTMLGLRLEDSAADRDARVKLAEAAAAAKKEEQTAGATERLGGELEKTGAPKFYAQYDEAQNILKRYPKDLPGLGRIDGRLPDEALTPDGRQLRFLVGQLLSEYRKGQTGAGMSDAERAEYGQITGLIYSGSDNAVRQGLDTLKRALDARVGAIKGGFRPEAVRTYEERVPSMRRAGTTAPGPVRVPPSKGLLTGPDGKPTIDDGGAVRKQYSRSRNRTRELDAGGNVIREYEGPPRG